VFAPKKIWMYLELVFWTCVCPQKNMNVLGAGVLNLCLTKKNDEAWTGVHQWLLHIPDLHYIWHTWFCGRFSPVFCSSLIFQRNHRFWIFLKNQNQRTPWSWVF
jgi:hypothetical protein